MMGRHSHAPFTQHPSEKHAKQAKPQVKSSHGPGGGMHIIPVDELESVPDDDATLATLALTEDAVLLAVEPFDDELADLLELLAPPADEAPPPVPLVVLLPSSSSSAGALSEPVAQLDATVTAIPKASIKPANFCTSRLLGLESKPRQRTSSGNGPPSAP